MRRQLITCVLWTTAGVSLAHGQASEITQQSVPVIVESAPVTSYTPAKKSDEPPPCPTVFNDSLETNGIAAKVGGDSGIVPPKPIHTVAAEMSDEARIAYKKKKTDTSEFVSMISLVVDTNGNPMDLCVKKAAGLGLDAEAGKAVRQYKFVPATKDGKPVAARIVVDSSFRFY